MEISRNILLTPGPATTSNSVKMAQVVPDICPREKEFAEVMQYVANNVTKIAGNPKKYTTILLGGSGTAAVDATINSVVPFDKKILIINNGAYGERMVQIAQAYSIQVVELKSAWEKPPELAEIEKILDSDSEIACIALVHHETTTGLLNPAKEIGALAKAKGKTFLLDAISSFAGLVIDMEEFQIDFMMASSNKCLQGMAGCSFVICQNEALQKTMDYPKRSFYLNLYQQYDFFLKTGQMRFTPPVQCLYALKKAIEEFWLEGLEKRQARYEENWETLVKGMEKLGFSKLLPNKWESKILVTYLYPREDFPFEKMHDLLYEKGFTIYPGKIGNKATFRLAGLGDVYKKDMEAFLQTFESIQRELQ